MAETPGPSKKPKWSHLEKVGLDQEVFFCGTLDERCSRPGKYRILSRPALKQSIQDFQRICLFPVILKPKSYSEVESAFKSEQEPMAFSKMSQLLSAEICFDEKYAFPVGAIFEQPSCFTEEGIVDRIESLIHHVSDICMVSNKKSGDSEDGQKDNDKHLWSDICSILLGSNSVVYEECEIVGGMHLPHGDIDIIAGHIDDTSGDIDFTSSFAVDVYIKEISDRENFDGDNLHDTHSSLATKALSIQVIFKHLAFSEVITNTSNVTVFFAGTEEAFRLFLRVKELDLLFTTESIEPWWDVRNCQPWLKGMVLLISLVLGVSSSFRGIQLVSRRVYNKSLKCEFPKTKWNKFYENSVEKYNPCIFPKKKGKEASDSKARKVTVDNMMSSEEYGRFIKDNDEVMMLKKKK